MNVKLRDVFSGKVVSKAHTIDTGVDEFPRYVLDHLIDNYCSENFYRKPNRPAIPRSTPSPKESSERRSPVKRDVLP